LDLLDLLTVDRITRDGKGKAGKTLFTFCVGSVAVGQFVNFVVLFYSILLTVQRTTSSTHDSCSFGRESRCALDNNIMYICTCLSRKYAKVRTVRNTVLYILFGENLKFYFADIFFVISLPACAGCFDDWGGEKTFPYISPVTACTFELVCNVYVLVLVVASTHE
jgi:hypothetical protein